jgi:hypothetical protein
MIGFRDHPSRWRESNLFIFPEIQLSVCNELHSERHSALRTEYRLAIRRVSHPNHDWSHAHPMDLRGRIHCGRANP